MKSFKIKIYSEGGQGIRSMIDNLEKDLKKFYTVSLVKYDSIVKGGVVESNLIISKKKIISPFFDVADLCIVLKKDFDIKIKYHDIIQIPEFKRNDSEDLKKKILEKIKV